MHLIVRRARNVLWYALALSIIVHLIVGPLLPKLRQPAPEPEPPIVTLQTPPPKPPLPQPPTPPPTPPPHVEATPHVAPLSRPVVVPPHATTSSSSAPVETVPPAPATRFDGAVDAATPGALPSASASPAPVASPTPTPKPACSAPHVDARALKAVEPELPDMAREQGLSGIVEVRVDLDGHSRIVGTGILRSSGSVMLDRAAVESARASSFATQIEDCVSVPGTYRFIVEFQKES